MPTLGQAAPQHYTKLMVEITKRGHAFTAIGVDSAENVVLQRTHFQPLLDPCTKRFAVFEIGVASPRRGFTRNLRSANWLPTLSTFSDSTSKYQANMLVMLLIFYFLRNSCASALRDYP
jgi:hypothetical protein